MASNRKSDGMTATFLLGSGETAVANGKGYLYGDLLSVVTALKRNGQPVVGASAQGDEATVALWGVWILPKTAAQAWAKGAKLYWDNTTGALTTTAGSNVEAGWAWEAQLAAATIGTVKLKG